MSESNGSRKALRMVACPACGAKVFISSEIPPLGSAPCTKCGHEVMMPMRLRQLELRSIIGQGGMGAVYRAFDLMLEREVAVKLMKRELTEDHAALDQFYREARACAALNHTNIIHVYSFDDLDGQLYLVLEIADQGSLDNRIEQNARVPELDVLDIGVKIASALDKALKHGLLHRDIKPGNILFNTENEPKLVDFGLARKTEAENDDDGSIWGTPYYIAPERVNREREDFLSDMYSLAATLYHALTGHVPFEGPDGNAVCAAHVHTPLTPPNQVVTDISEPTSDALVCAMSKDPSQRFQSYDEFIMALTNARSQLLISQIRPQGGGVLAKAGSAKSWWRR